MLVIVLASTTSFHFPQWLLTLVPPILSFLISAFPLNHQTSKQHQMKGLDARNVLQRGISQKV